MSRKPHQAFVYLVIGSAIVFAGFYVHWVTQFCHESDLGWLALGLLGFKTAVEVIACVYGFSFLYCAVAHLCSRPESPKQSTRQCYPPVGIIYLCCDDLDVGALETLSSLRYPGKLHLVVHDDSTSTAAKSRTRRVVENLRQKNDWDILLLSRSEKEGGKAGALNYVLQQTGDLYEFFLLCDNDSTAIDSASVQKALAYFDDDRIAIVQCRSVGAASPDYCPVNELLSRSVDIFHVFMSTYAKYGWLPFIGHNAFLRTRAVREVGGWTPGFFSDDLDLTVRLNLKGYSVAYAPDIQVGEKHPPSVTAFRKRSYKWAYGCLQSLRAHTGSVLKSRRFTLAEKFCFFQFAGFYVGQMLLLVYLAATFLVSPFVFNAPVNQTVSLIAGTAIILLVYLPTLAYFLKSKDCRNWFESVLLCGLVYGSTDFTCARGIWDCLWNRRRKWIPTNQRTGEENNRALLGEALFGLALLLVPLVKYPALLALPCTYLFAGKFLFGPAMFYLYDDDRRKNSTFGMQPMHRREALLPKTAVTAIAVVVLASVATAVIIAETHGRHGTVEIRGKQLVVDGRPFVVKGIHYGPWRPGTGPNKNYPYPSAREVEQDLILIRNLHANTILAYDPPEYLLDLADKHGLMVLYCFTINWWAIGTEQDADAMRGILTRVKQYQHKPAVLAWVLGNEIPTYALTQRGEGPIVDGLAKLYRDVKAIDGAHPVTHCNWPITKDLKLRFFDIASFNVYPLWPPDVVARGYGNYIKEELQTIAADKPLLITEFGVNNLEAGEFGQARILKQCWTDIGLARACGGVVFEFADEWWKNYDNPIRSGSWWNRAPAPNDENTHDVDPEEYYGLMTAYREPKPAYDAVKKMFGEQTQPNLRAIPLIITSSLILVAIGSWLWSRRALGARPRHVEPTVPVG